MLPFRKPMLTRHCARCGAEFETRRAARRFCSPNCQKQDHTRRLLQEARGLREQAKTTEVPSP